MKYSRIFIVFTMILIAVISIRVMRLPSAAFCNLEPSLSVNGIEYLVTEEVTSESNLEKRVAKVRQQVMMVSYTDRDNPYKGLKYVWSIKSSDSELALEMNNKYYIVRRFD